MSPPQKTFSRPISTKAARCLSTKHCVSTIQHTTSRGVQMSSTSVHDPISWLSLLKAITPILIDTAGLLISSRSPSTTEAQSKSPADLRGRRSKSSGCAGLNWTHKDGFSHLRIPRLQFAEPSATTEWHSFIAPSDVQRATHTIPAFAWGLMDPQHCPKGSHAVRFLEKDWNCYYVNM